MSRKFLIFLFLVSILIVVFLAPLASPLPDGLETVAKRLGIDRHEKEPLFRGIFPDYEAEYFSSPYLKVIVPGIVGVSATFALTSGIYLLFTRKKGNGTRFSG
ncbi:MAG: PDGLE domain-containing protein [Actinobacteria bacterium]|nr:PDGLE domain-containing protein [Actinomycetota bacterium]